MRIVSFSHGISINLLPKFNNSSVELFDDTAKAIYCDLIEKIERMSEIIYLVVPKFTTAAYFFPNIILTFVNFYVRDLGDEAYYSAFPMM